MPDVHTLVVGAGIAGLAAALEAAEYGDIVVLEAQNRVGGMIRSERVDGYLCEAAAATLVLPAPGTSTVVATTGVSEDLLPAGPEATRRWTHRPGGLVEIPTATPSTLRSSLTEMWAEPASAMPVAVGRTERRRWRRARPSDGPPTTMYQFSDGMETLPQGIAEVLGADTVRLDSFAESLARVDGHWRVETTNGAFRSRRLLIAVGPGVASRLLDPIESELAALLRDAVGAPVAIVHLGVDPDTLAAHRGYGFLAHPSGRLRILGAVFDSVLFPGRAPANRALVRVLVGGGIDPGLVELDDDELVTLSSDDLTRALGREVTPVWSHVIRPRAGILQYGNDHAVNLKDIHRRVAGMSGVALVGWGYGGLGVNSVIADALSRVRSLPT